MIRFSIEEVFKDKKSSVYLEFDIVNIVSPGQFFVEIDTEVLYG